MMNTETLRNHLKTDRIFDLNYGSSLTTENGMKISIQGKCVEDSISLYMALVPYLFKHDIPFKVATQKRYNAIKRNPEQARKAFTIYAPDGFNFAELCEKVYTLTSEYKGWYDIKTPTSYEHYAGGVFTRNDRDGSGQYVPAKNN